MAPGVTTETHGNGVQAVPVGKTVEKSYPKPLEKTGAIDHFEYEDVTTAIGREYPTVNVVDDILKAPNADELIRELGITISQRGVVFFRKQDNMTDETQKELVTKMGRLTGKPESSHLYIHPVLNPSAPHTKNEDLEISTISHKQMQTMWQVNAGEKQAGIRLNSKWHTDTQFEKATSDYACLRLIVLPKCGGDTLWASGYEMLHRFSPTYRKFLEGLTVTCSDLGLGYKAVNSTLKSEKTVNIYDGERGSPLNVGTDLSAVHPCVRTNPVTGWKSLYSAGLFPHTVNELRPNESQDVLDKCFRSIVDNHDLVVRFRWRNPNDFAIWDNRCTFHAATYDIMGQGDRYGHRVVSIGEAPYLDPNSTSKGEALGGIWR